MTDKNNTIVIEILSSESENDNDDHNYEGKLDFTTSQTKTCSGANTNLNPFSKKSPLFYQPSEKWKETIRRCEELNVQFVDDAFPPNSSSIDGRKIHLENKQMKNSKDAMTDTSSSSIAAVGKEKSNSVGTSTQQSCEKKSSDYTTTTIKCRCGVPASIRTVQRDGPNYGRFFLSCGRKRPRVSKRKTTKRKRHNHDDDNNDDNNNSEHKSKKISDVVVIEIDEETVSIQDHDTQVTTKNSFESNKNNLKPQCTFFQWDDNHKQVSYSTSRSSWMHYLSWFRYEKKHGYSLTYPKGCFAPEHVKQGGMGDCWFLSALAVVAEKGYLIQQLLPHSELNSFGCYEVRFCLDGTFTSVLVDSFLPSIPIQKKLRKQSNAEKKGKDNDKGDIHVEESEVNVENTLSLQPVFASGNVSWPAIIEKAYAKVHGSYARLSGGYISEALYDLTGAPIERVYFYNVYDYDQLFARLLSFVSSGFLMGIATSKGGDGLVSFHAYSLLGVYEIHDVVEGSQEKMTQYIDGGKSDVRNPCNHVERRTVRLACIRNPWGSREWKGKWSATSDQWTRKIRMQLGDKICKQGNGTFFMSYEDMIQRFDHLDIAKCQEGWLRASLGGVVKLNESGDVLSSSPLVYYCKTQEKTWSYLSFVQKKKRANTTTQFWYTDISMIILKRKHNSDSWIRYQSILQGVKRSCDIELFMDPEFEYCIIPFSFLGGIEELQCGSQAPKRKAALFRLTSYSAHRVELKAKPRKLVQNQEMLVESLHFDLLGSEEKETYSLGPSSALVAVFENGCLYFLILNAALNGLMVKLVVESKKGRMVVHGLNYDTHIIPSESQCIVLVLTNKGHHDGTTGINFNFQADICREKISSAQKFIYKGVDTRRKLSLAGELLCESFGSVSGYKSGRVTFKISRR